MNQVQFGRMKRSVSRMGLGAWALGSSAYGIVDREEALKIIEHYLNSGGNFLDTAIGYHQSQEIIGEYIRSHPAMRRKIFLCSKTGRLKEEEIKADVEASLISMNTDYIDLYYLHAPPSDPRERDRVIALFDDLKAQGMIRGVGASIKGPNVTEETQVLCRQYIETGLIDAIQLIYSMIRQTNHYIFKQAREKGVAIVARTALESGFLTGKYKPGHKFPEKDHRNRWGSPELDRVLREAEILKKEKEIEFSSLSEKALRFVYDEPDITNMIAGATSKSQLEKNLQAAEMTPPSKEWRQKIIDKYANRYDLGNFS